MLWEWLKNSGQIVTWWHFAYYQILFFLCVSSSTWLIVSYYCQPIICVILYILFQEVYYMKAPVVIHVFMCLKLMLFGSNCVGEWIMWSVFTAAVSVSEEICSYTSEEKPTHKRKSRRRRLLSDLDHQHKHNMNRIRIRLYSGINLVWDKYNCQINYKNTLLEICHFMTLVYTSMARSVFYQSAWYLCWLFYILPST